MDKWSVTWCRVKGDVGDVAVKAMELGRDGWELVQVGQFIPGIGNESYDTYSVVWFKRKLD